MTFHAAPSANADAIDNGFAAYAMSEKLSRGRRHRESSHAYRSAYQRDRDRIVHSTGFRRLMYKTQVFVGQPNDHQRTRLTHTLEVAQIARTIARLLRLNEDLAEAIALSHDLGHPPFGHAGERALNALMTDHGGYEHNRQGLRLVEKLEVRYPDFDGINLSYEILESMALHSHERQHPDIAEFDPSRRMLAESQAVDAADSIAYDAHDIDDALRAGLIQFEDLRDVELWRQAEERTRAATRKPLAGKQLARSVIRQLVDWQMGDLLTESRERLAAMNSVEAVQRAPREVIALSDELTRLKTELEKFLFDRVYRHEQVVRTTRVAERLIGQVFEELVRDPRSLPDKYQRRFNADSRERVICDYVAGMTDRFAQRCHRELFEP